MKKLLFVAAFGVAMCSAASCASATKRFNAWFGSDSASVDTVVADSVDSAVVDSAVVDTLPADSAVVDTVVADSVK